MQPIALFMKLLLQFLILTADASPAGYGYPPIVKEMPQQLHIAYGKTPNEMTIVWSQVTRTKTALVRYGMYGALDQIKYGNSTMFVDGGTNHSTQYISKVTLDNLIPGAKYTYVVGNEFEYSDEHTFVAMPAGQDWSPCLAMYGDMGNVNARSLPRLENDAFSGMYDAILHVGDFAYDMRSEEGAVGDEFMRQIQPMAANFPYMTCPGNHEEAYNFSHYRYRFAMPGDEGRMYYSFNMGPVHFVSVSTELIFYWYYGAMQVFWQYEWLKQDLEEANKPENRAVRPWVVVFGHRPMYCSNNDKDDCTQNESIIRTGVPILHIFGFEDLFYDNGVDLAIWAHEHSYERLWPVYNRKVMNGSYEFPYTNPKAPVHIITGSAGCRENITPFVNKRPDWSAFNSTDYGYARMQVLNKTHLHIEQVSDIQGGKVIDSIMIIKDQHGAYDKSGKKRALDLPKDLTMASIQADKAWLGGLP